MTKKKVFILFIFILLICSITFLLKGGCDILQEKQGADVMIGGFWLSLKQYAYDHSGTLPDDLGTLYDEEYLNNGPSYILANKKFSIPHSGKDINAGACAFLYLGKGKKILVNNTMEGSKTEVFPILATKSVVLNNGKILVLLSNGTIKKYSSYEKFMKGCNGITINNLKSKLAQ